MNNTNLTINITLTAVEMATIHEALCYTARQVNESGVPAFENYEPIDKDTGVATFDEEMYLTNQTKAELALALADTLELIGAAGYDWKVYREDSRIGERFVDVWCCHNKTNDFGMPLVREFIWNYTSKQSGMPTTVYTSVLEDCVMPCNTTVAVHYVPYTRLTDKNVVHYYSLDEIKNKVPNITEDPDVNDAILNALRSFLSYGIADVPARPVQCMDIVATYVTDKGTIYASIDGNCWINEVGDTCMNLATGECIEVLSSETDEDGNVDKLYYQI